MVRQSAETGRDRGSSAAIRSRCIDDFQALIKCYPIPNKILTWIIHYENFLVGLIMTYFLDKPSIELLISCSVSLSNDFWSFVPCRH
jgi:hypothetical protein